ncbi:hypothetical protein [Humibacter ginsenosidimutans]|uniref:Peptidylprolyl isomerase n=1 Tax=Humibacter ginsenosidimutans TaxID=2599293 RepID=A0A5B8LYY1_9MICO|nr:hypothetical protein [Humibacter ginsenosidimutans]QDZ13718.1 hypothetical protein FPZ11_01940 [Humibacter ginsenosidimutans]
MRTLLARRASERTSRTRRLGTVAVAAAIVAVGLTGCSAAGSGDCVQPGAASELIPSSGTATASSWKFPKPLHADSLQKSTLTSGKGAEIVDGQPVILDVGIFNGLTGKAVVTAAQGGMISASTSGSQLPGLQKALLCSTVGSRIAVTGTVTQVLGKEAQLNIPASSTVVAVATVKKAFLARADGTPRPGQPGMPTVVLAPNGQPGIKIPSHDAPKTLSTAILKQGSGETVKKGDYTVVNYTAVAWNSPDTVASSSWQNGSADIWPATDGSVPTTVTNKLIGEKVGTQLIVVTPGSNATAYVIDILGIAK